MTVASTKRTRRYDSQIQAEAGLKFGPQADALALLLQQAKTDRGSEIHAARSAGRMEQAYATQHLPLAQQLASQYAGLPNAAPELVMAQQEWLQRGQDALAGAAGGVRAAEDRYSGTKQKLAQALQSLAGQQGDFASARLADLLQTDRKQAHETAQKTADRANARLTAGVNPDGTIIPGGPKDPAANGRNKNKPKAVKWATPQQVGSFRDNVEAMRGWIRQHKGDYKSRSAIAQDLLNGVPGSTIADPKTGNLLKDPGVPKAKSQLALSVALDLEYDRHVSHGNIEQLHRRRYRVRDLGYPIAPSAPRPVPAPASATAGFPGVGMLGPVGVR
jgi:hypothetical protein